MHRSHGSRRRLPVAVSLILGCLLLAGCGRGGSSGNVYPVKGKVMVQGKPAAGALIVFHPKGNDNANAVRPSATVDESGVFELTSFKAKDGAPAGDYDVAITWDEAPAAAGKLADGAKITGMGGAGENRTIAPDRLGGKYRDYRTSGLKATVKAGTNEELLFDLK